MKTFISIHLASKIVITLSTLALVMHVLILLQIIPYDFVWGGRLNSLTNVMVFESISIIVLLLFISFTAIKAGYILRGRFNRIATLGIWIMFGVMILNTIGNIASNSFLETILMTPITSLLALLLFRIGID